MSIKCSKCNFDNETPSSFCSNCGFTFPIDEIENKKSFVDNSALIHPTIIERSEVDEGNSDIEENCPKCSYLLTSVHNECPNCGFAPKRKTKEESPKNIEPDKKDELIASNNISASEIHQPVIVTEMVNEPDIAAKKPELNTKLVSISLNNTSREDILITSDHQVISRKDVSESDLSVSASEHCIISKKEGKWIIENKGSNKAVFIQVTESTELVNDTMILIGDKSFYKFECEEE